MRRTLLAGKQLQSLQSVWCTEVSVRLVRVFCVGNVEPPCVRRGSKIDVIGLMLVGHGQLSIRWATPRVCGGVVLHKQGMQAS